MSIASINAQAGVRLRALRRDDLPTLHRWHQDPDMVATLGGAFTYRSEVETLAHMEGWLAGSRTEVRLAIARAADDALIGSTSLQHIHPAYRSADFHLLLGDTADRGRGYGRAAGEMILTHGFHDLGLHRIECDALETNTSARRMDESLGFEVEGIKRQAAWKAGRWVDLVIMGLLRERFEAHRRLSPQPRPPQ